MIENPSRNCWNSTLNFFPVAEYRPNSESSIYKVNTETLKVEEAFRVNDHIGEVVKNDKTGKLHGVSWGSRLFYEWNKKGKQLGVEDNSSHFVDYQDCESAGKAMSKPQIEK